MTLEKLTREELLDELRAFEKLARKHGWSEEVNCTPWGFLDGQIENLTRRLARAAPQPTSDEPVRPAAHVLTRGLGTDIPPRRRG